MFASNSVLRGLKVLTSNFPLLFLVKISLQFCYQNLIRDFNPLSGKNDSAALYLFTEQYTETDFQKQPSRGVLGRRCSENMQQICRRTPMPKDDWNFLFSFFFFFIGSYIYIGKSVQANETTAKFIKSDKRATKIWETMLPFCQQLPQEAGIELWNHKNSLRSRNIKNWFSLKVSYTHIAFLPSSIVKQMKFKFSKIRLLFFFFLIITTTSPLIDFPNCTDRLRRILKNWVNDTAKSK